MRLIRDDRGMTLPELLIAMIILTVIIGPMSGALIVYMRNSEATVIRMGESQDIQLASSYFAGDVASLGVRDTSLNLLQSIDNSTYACTTTGTPVVRFAWHEANGASLGIVRVYYMYREVGAERRLVRVICQPDGNNTSDGEVVLIRNLTAQPPPPTCAPAACNATGANFPRTVSLAVSIKHPNNPNAPISLTLTGQRRQS